MAFGTRGSHLADARLEDIFVIDGPHMRLHCEGPRGALRRLRECQLRSEETNSLSPHHKQHNVYEMHVQQSKKL